MNAEIISVGTELLLGHTINSDAAYVARELSAFGINLLHTHVVGDNPTRLDEALRLSLSRSDLVITTGGLGPTDDDLTKDVVSRVTGAPLEEHAQSMARLREYFGERVMTPNQLKQAFLPRGSTVFQNETGTAPGCAVPAGKGKCVILLPGPPNELQAMLQSGVIPFLRQFSQGAIVSVIIRTFGIGEGAAALCIRDLTESANPSAATYAAEGEMFVRITAKAQNRPDAENLAGSFVTQVCERLKNFVYGIDVSNLESVVVPELIKRNLTVATAESCTGGLLAKRITDQPGASAIFHTGLVTYADEAKRSLLGVSQEMLREHGAVSECVARCMAENVRLRYGSDLGMGITGIAGPSGGSDKKPVGLVYIALSSEKGNTLRIMRPQGRYPGRAWTRNQAASHALDLLRRHLFNLPPLEG